LERAIEASPERVFDWLADPANLTGAPLALKAGFAKGSSGPGVGALREVTGAGGKVMEAVTSRLLRWSFLAILAGCADALESDGMTTAAPSHRGRSRRS
jgi:hypothetical protein